MSTIEKTIDVEVPVSTAYDQWTQFESFPRFMEGVESVTQIDDRHLHWKADIGGVVREWDAEIVDQTPDQQITWRSLDGTDNKGTVQFRPADAGTQVTLRLDYDPEGFVEKVGDVLKFVEGRVTGDLNRFKEFVETRGTETGGWRGEVKPTGEVDPDPHGGNPLT